MTSTSEYYQGREVHVVDNEHPLFDTPLKIVVIRQCKKGFLCAIENGIEQVFKQSQIEPYSDN